MDPYKETNNKIQALDMQFLGSVEKTRRDRIRNEMFRDDVGIQNLLLELDEENYSKKNG
jgi:hypothetical protein